MSWLNSIDPDSIPRGGHITSEDLSQWMRENRIEEVECLVPDMAGIARGKAMPAGKFAGLSPTYLPISIFGQSITGDYPEVETENWWVERDVELVPDLSTLRTVPWASEPTIQVIHDLREVRGEPINFAPRNVLKRVLAAYRAEGWSPVVAPELEFYLTRRNIDPNNQIEPPIGRSGRRSAGRQAFAIAAVDEYEPIINDLYDFAEAQGLEIDAIAQEGGAAQLEINLIHGEPVELADRVFVFKRLIREAAYRHDCYATFMAKAMDREPGSAMHIHQSVLDSEGRNIFSNEDGSPSDTFYHFIGGQQRFLPAAMSFFAPYVNSYRRLLAGMSAPRNLEWSTDNRSTGLRIPNSNANNRRVENRVAGADANPYLAIAVTLAIGYLGIKGKISPREEVRRDTYEMPFTLPSNMQQALAELERCEELRDLLTDEFVDLYITIKRHELDEFMQVITPWEREHLLLQV